MNWQEIIAFGIVASTAFVLAFRTIRQWMGTAKTIGGCGGCKGCGSQRQAPKAAPTLTQNSYHRYELLQLERNPSRKDIEICK